MRAWVKQTMVLIALSATASHAQKMPAYIFSGGGGTSQSADGSIRHFSAIGIGMAVGDAQNGTHRAHHGFLGGAQVFANRDVEPPVFDPPLADLTVPVNDDECFADFRVPDITVVDDRDRNPTVAMSLIVSAAESLNVQPGQNIRLGPGSYDVLVVTADRRGNTREGAFVVDIVDNTDPLIANVPNPTPLARPAEATSPAGTRVAINFECSDNCDADPIEGDVREVFPFGATDVDLTCTDNAGNESDTPITIRVGDNTPPEVLGNVPDTVQLRCNAANGAVVNVPQVAWRDNATLPNLLERRLIVNPDADPPTEYCNTAGCDPIPDQLELSVAGSPHILRFQATDQSGRTGSLDLRVEVQDDTGPRIIAANIPESGWFNADASFTFSVEDNCATAENIDPTIEPVPTRVTRDGNVFTVEYARDGRYNLNIAVTDDGGNVTRDNSISFGVDRTPPEVVVAVPRQRGIIADDPLTYPFHGKGESLALNVGAEDVGDGEPSGIKSVTVIASPGEFLQRTLAETSYNGAGSPVRGDRSVANINCTTNALINGKPLCTNGAVNLRYLDSGTATIRVVVEDFAGNTGTYDARYVNGDLAAAMERASARLNGVINPCETCPDVGELPEDDNITRAIQILNQGFGQAQPSHVASPFGTPIFLGGAVKAAERAMAEVDAAIAVADDPTREAIYADQAQMVSRAAWSDLKLYNEWIDTLRPAFGKELYIQDSYAADMERVTDGLTAMEEAVDRQDWLEVLSQARQAVFFQKMAHQLWIMNWNAQPQPWDIANVSRDNVNYAEYFQARDILIAIENELDTYLQTVQDPPAENRVQAIRDLLGDIVANLDLLLTDGVSVGLSDREYLRTLMDLRNIAISSKAAENEGAYMRPYQYSMMMIVRWLTQFSLASALHYETREGSDDFAIYQWAQQSIDEGREYLENGEVERVINLYGSQSKALCPIIGIYHCWYLVDETELPPNAGDNDQPLADIALPAVCTDSADNDGLGMLLPSEWQDAAAQGGDVPPACRATIPE
ncbi:MAG: hypothetical protein VX589_08140 [Myxococcota bacterium]|nr:hypothetical protein [Myxococcota bacterium]